ncbi:phage gp6-like head-tail connector protein [Peribacillus sp. TH24]|uniref:phage gp6-like head-tail connector protein n=1 Tax=Peribacillus sp. TH24 TaxID=2798483 RepID=UPI0019144D42|nr:phage gp6-like head-tail connector protein [Peribacillus sp. TH24]MBK5446063.1 phage gp6-like head-tail connector protein [Peribacillus sp. TH24]
MTITDELLARFKKRLKISHSIEDETLKDILSTSVEDIKAKCGYFTVESNERARELVFERSRYVYNDALEFFNDNFASQITSLALELYIPSGEITDETKV